MSPRMPAFTASGVIQSPLHLQQQDVRAWDIAWSLSNQNLFGGASFRPWSYLSHTGLAYLLLKKSKLITEIQVSAETEVALLLNEAWRTYLSVDDYPEEELKAQGTKEQIFERFGLAQSQIDQQVILTFSKQARYVASKAFFPEHTAHYSKLCQYPVAPEETRVNRLFLGKPADYIKLLQTLCPNPPESGQLFKLPDSIAPYIHEPADTTQPSRRVETDSSDILNRGV